MTTRYFLLSLLACLALSSQTFAQCDIDSGVPLVPGIYPPTVPVAQGCEFYETDITFYLPRDTALQVLGQTIVAPFVSFEITEVTGLPDGMNWICNLDSVGCLYDVSPTNLSPDTLGCVRIFGTADIPNTYQVIVYVEATARVLGNDLVQIGTYTLQLEVSPCLFSGACYDYLVSSNCEPAVLELSNNLPSGGDPRYRYRWEVSGPVGFSYQTSDENPFNQFLPQAGQYVIQYEAEIDTFPYSLNAVEIVSVNCSDPFDAADLYWRLFAPDGTELVSTAGSPVNNASLPLNTGISGIVLDTGTYRFEVLDSDNIGNDQGCAGGSGVAGASVYFTVPPLAPGIISASANGLNVDFQIDHPIQQAMCSDTFELAPLPSQPEILFDTLRLCAGDSLDLRVVSTDSLVWYHEDSLLQADGDSLLRIAAPGRYQVVAVDRSTLCAQASEPVEVTTFQVAPPSIAFNGNQTVRVAAPDDALRYDWYETNDGLAGSGTRFTLPRSGTWYAVAVDTATGCQSAPSPEIDLIVADTEAPGADWQLATYPNPLHDQLKVSLNLPLPAAVTFSLHSLLGQELRRHTLPAQSGPITWEADLSALPAGVYLLKIQAGEAVVHRRLLKR
jgi:hypothetical protein